MENLLRQGFIEEIREALASSDRDAVNLTINVFLQRVVEEIQSGSSTSQRELMQVINEAMGPYRELLHSEMVDLSMMVGKFDAMNAVLSAIWEDKPTDEELEIAKDETVKRILLKLRKELFVKQKALDLEVPDAVTQEAAIAKLNDAILICDTGDQETVEYRLTVRGSILAQALDRSEKK